MTHYWLELQLLSDTTFGRGDGVAGFVDAEVQHDSNGLPYLSGKTLKGLLTAVCAEIMQALELAQAQHPFADSARRLFGGPGSREERAARLHVGDAMLPGDLRRAIAYDVAHELLRPAQVLDSLTTLRRQTAMDAETGAPLDETLRTMRVIVHDLPFVARLDYWGSDAEWAVDQALLAACVRGLRRVGSGRNRGRGRVRAELYDAEPDETASPVTAGWFATFEENLKS